MKGVISRVSKAVVPSKTAERAKNRVADLAFELVESKAKKYSEVTGLEFGGSFAKGTWLAKDADVDIFLRFRGSTPADKFEKIARKIGFDSLKEFGPYVRYSEHPYVEAKIKDTKVNIVPFYDVRAGRWKSAADRSPYHTKFMRESLTPKMRNEVRILKTFLQANRIYGAEIAKQGFSGYVSEVLILNYGSFEGVIRSISEIKEGAVIGKTRRRFGTPVAIIDPIDKNRNLAAAISDENLGRLVLASRAFRERPSMEFFRTRKPRPSRRYLENLLVVSFEYKSRGPETIWGQIKKATSSLATRLELEGFRVLRSSPHTDQRGKAWLLFLLESAKIPGVRQKRGPEFFREGASKSFISENLRNRDLMWMGRDRRIFSMEKRRHTDAARFMREFLGKNLRTGVPKGLMADFKRGFRVSYGSRGLGKSIKEAADELGSTDGVLLYFN